MSNATQDSRQSGDSRRRRSRGGQKRRTNNNNNSENRQGDGERREGRSQRSGGQQQGRQSPQRRMPAPPKLTFWQKMLKAVGLYKEPVRPPRPERRADAAQPEARSGEARRSNTRNARSGDDRGEREERPPREPRAKKERGDRGERNSNRQRGGDRDSVESARVYVGNLSYDVTESDLEELFKGVGAVRRTEIVYNRSTHRSKGYGFVQMLDIDEAKRAVEVLHDQFFMGRQLTVSGAKSKDYEAAEDEEKVPEVAPVKPVKPIETVTDLISPQPEVKASFAEPVPTETEEITATELETDHIDEEKKQSID